LSRQSIAPFLQPWAVQIRGLSTRIPRIRSVKTLGGLKIHDYLNRDGLNVNVRNKIIRAHRRRKKPLLQSVKTITPDVQTNRYDILETITIIAMELQKRHKTGQRLKSFNALKRRLSWIRMVDLEQEAQNFKPGRNNDDSQSFICAKLKEHDRTVEELWRWIKCIKATKIKDAFRAMQRYDDWPEFLVLFTLGRRCGSRLDAHKIIRLFQRTSPALHRDVQFALFIRTLRIVEKWLIEFVPVLCRMFILHCHPDLKQPALYNQLLWLVAKFGTSWKPAEAAVLAEALRIVVTEMSEHSIRLDTKGYLAIAYVTSFGSIQRARALMDVVRKHEYEYSKEELEAISDDCRLSIGTFPYKHGLYAMDVLLSRDSFEALRAFDRIPKSERNAALWAVLITRLRDLKQLTPSMTNTLLAKIEKDGVRMTSYLLRRVLEGYDSPMDALEVLTRYVRRNTSILRTGVIVRCLKIESAQDLDAALLLVSRLKAKPLQLYETILSGAATWRPTSVWNIYQQMRRDGFEPTDSSLFSICRAASDMKLMWGDLYAVQRAVVEYKKWVRGAAEDGSDVQDVFKVYPTMALFHQYLVMIGKARYTDELLEVLPWMKRIQFAPDKRCLCALIINAPNGAHLFAHGKKVGGEWPTEEELETYRTGWRRPMTD
jgi:hypothetical protein